MRGLGIERLEPVFDESSPIGAIRAMRTWYTTKPCQPSQRAYAVAQLNDVLRRHDGS